MPGQQQQRQAEPAAEEEAQLAKLQKCYDTCCQQMGSEHEASLRFGVELQKLKGKLQAAKPLGMQMQSAQSKLQQLEYAMLKAHEDVESCDDELAAAQLKREAVLVRGRELQRQCKAATAEVGKLAGLLAAPIFEQGGTDFERIATAAMSSVPAGHPQRDAVGGLLQQIFGLLSAAA